MNFDEPTIDELNDAIIEDTVHCDFCGASWVLGSSGDGICCNLPVNQPVFAPSIRSGQLKLCMDCAAFVSLTYEQELREADQCEHGVLCGEWCEPCNREYREARESDG